MANTVKMKRSAVAGKIPTTADLDLGEIAINTYDGVAYIKKDVSGTQTVVPIGVGNVTGAASSTDNALVRFDGTTGKVIQNSVVTLDDTGNESGLLSEQYNTNTTPPAIVAGLEAWDSGNGTLELGLLGGNVSYKYGQQEFARVYNGSASTMTKGQIVYIIGAQGNRIDVRLALATADGTSAGTIGMVVDSIAAGAEGWVQVSGTVYKLNTSTLTAGQTIYLSPTTAGAYTTTKPVAPNHLVVLGFVERVSATVGSIYLKVDNGYELDELHNVLITSPTSGNTLIYDAVAGVWENANITAGSGINVTNGAGSITVSVASIVNSMIYDTFTAIASQTTFTTSQSYTSGKISVFKNGAKMRNGSDVTVTSGSSVVFAVACTLNDVIDIDYPTASTSGNFIYDTFTATASQTTFTSSTSYTGNKIDVYVNGAKVRNGTDVTVSGGSSVVFATGLAVGSLVDLVYPT